MKKKSPKKAVCLLSGGLDSATVLYMALREGYSVHALTISYGQRHAGETVYAEKIAKKLRVPWKMLNISLPWKGSALLDNKTALPGNRDWKAMSRDIPVTYVPARNTIFLSFALSWAEVLGADAVFIGANALDYSGYPDCRPEYFQQMEKVYAKGTKTGVEGKRIKIKTPLLRKSKAQIIRLAVKYKVPLEQTWSCYAGGKSPCGHCDSCLLRAKGFSQAGIKDPALKGVK